MALYEPEAMMISLKISLRLLPVLTSLLVTQLSCLCVAQIPDVSDPCASAATQHHFGDIAYFVPEEELAKSAGAATERVKRGATSRVDRLWQSGIIYYSFSESFTESETMLVVEAMRHWENHTCIRFKRRTNQYSYINFFQGSGCCSYVGNLNYGMQGISLSKYCLKFPTIVHEIGHAVGFWHEHTRPDRDNYVDVLYDNIIPGYENNFEKIDPSDTDSHGVGYDYNSIMHYNKNYFTLFNGLDTLRAKDVSIPLGLAVELSPLDIEQTNRLYSNECDEWRPSSLPPPSKPTMPSLPYSCGAIFPDISGTFTSPGYPLPTAYSSNTDCAWLVQPRGGFLLFLELHNVTFEESNDCVKEYIKIYEGSDQNGILRATICASYQQYPTIVVGTGSVLIVFHSDHSVQRNGFVARYSTSDVNECLHGGRCSHYCRNTFGGFDCSCQHGFYLSPDGRTCFDINECGVSNGGCKDICVNTGGSYHCACEPGQILQPDQVSCRPPGASCSIGNGGCHHNCTETIDSRECSCVHGFRLEPDGRTCFDINECYYSELHGCQYKCINFVGSYICVCRRGYHLNLDNRTCVPDRVCSVNNGECDHKCRSGGDGSALCYCLRGYRLGTDGTTCEDIDECFERSRLCQHTCTNTNSSYVCTCRDGFQLNNNGDCRNVDECLLHTDECQFTQYCRDNYGSYTCGCPSGYNLGPNRRDCIDIDECELWYKYICTHGCRNTNGSYECLCPEGFVLDGLWYCKERDECLDSSHLCDGQTGAQCLNTPGSYACLCPEGYVIDSSGLSCRDVDSTEQPTIATTNADSSPAQPAVTTTDVDSSPAQPTVATNNVDSSPEQPTVTTTNVDSSLEQTSPASTNVDSTEKSTSTNVDSSPEQPTIAATVVDSGNTEQPTTINIEQPTIDVASSTEQPPITDTQSLITRITELQSSESTTDPRLIQSGTTHALMTTDLQSDSETTKLATTQSGTTNPPIPEFSSDSTETGTDSEIAQSATTYPETKYTSDPVTNLEPNMENEFPSSCLEAACEQICTIPAGEAPRCSCREGYTPSDDGKSCDDINECGDANGGCTQICTNSLGSFSCNCPPLHYLSINGYSCIYYGPPTYHQTTPTTTPFNTLPIQSSSQAPTGATSQTTPIEASSQPPPIDTPSPQTPPTETSSTPTSTSSQATTSVIESTTITHSSPTMCISRTTTVRPTVAIGLPSTEELTPEGELEYQCGGLLTNNWGSFHSENWPETYPVNVNCEWTISLPDPSSTVEISFNASTFGIAGGFPKCRKDWVKVKSLGRNDEVVANWGPFCAYSIPPIISTKTSVAKVQFYAGPKHGSSRKGFKIHYQALEKCDVPNPPPISVEESEGCVESNIKLYTGLSVNNNYLIKTVCGRLRGEERNILIRSSYMVLQMTVNNGTNARGFHAVLEST